MDGAGDIVADSNSRADVPRPVISPSALGAVGLSSATVTAVTDASTTSGGSITVMHTATGLAAPNMTHSTPQWMSDYLRAQDMTPQWVHLCEEQLVQQEAFTSQHIFALTPPEILSVEYLTSLGITGKGIQVLLLHLHRDLRATGTSRKSRSSSATAQVTTSAVAATDSSGKRRRLSGALATAAQEKARTAENTRKAARSSHVENVQGSKRVGNGTASDARSEKSTNTEET